MIRPERTMPASFVWLGEVVFFVRECGEGVTVRTADGLECLAWWDELEELKKS
tara:strand:+ start:4467 stop:4625 length:159 start_codon:yes stop_codon:yes gene_type:complete